MPVTPAIPTRDDALLAYLYNWKQLMTATPANFGMLAADAVAITAQWTAFNAAMILVTNPATKTAATVADKNYKKALMLILLRQQYGLIKANPSVSDLNKTSIGVRINDPVPTPIPPPSTNPVFSAVNNAPLSMLLDVHDVLTPTSRRKPDGVTGLILVKSVGVVAATDPAQCQFEGLFSRSPCVVATFAPADAGKICTFFGRWANAKGEEGPWSAAVTQIVTN
jgi:hypothetical protein